MPLLVEGYRIGFADDKRFKFMAEINIDNDRLWPLLIELGKQLPEPVCMLFGLIGEQVQYSKYTDFQYIMDLLEPLQREIVQDGFLQFGLLHDDVEFVEVYIKESKTIMFWGVNHEAFAAIMQQFGLPHVPDIAFAEYFPLVTTSLASMDESVVGTEEMIEYLGSVLA